MSSYFRLDSHLESEMEKQIGDDRFAPYLTAAGNRSDALRLYSWNAAIAGALLGPISMLEVGLRNAIARRLHNFGSTWYDDPSFLALDTTSRTRDSISVAKSRIGRTMPSRPITEGRIVAELYLSFWVYLLRPSVSRTLWLILRPGFTQHTRRKTLVRYLEPIVPFRNRIAHHEPIFNRRPKEIYDGLLMVAGMLSDNLPDWIEHHARIRSVLADGPVTTGIKF